MSRYGADHIPCADCGFPAQTDVALIVQLADFSGLLYLRHRQCDEIDKVICTGIEKPSLS
jgi:hypothetical protein